MIPQQPSWQRTTSSQCQTQPQQGGPFTPNSRTGQSPYAVQLQSPSPLTHQGNPPSVYGAPQRTPRTPGGPMDIHSPLSNTDTSTPYGRGLNSVDNQLSCTVGIDAIVPEAHSLVLTLLLSDTFVDLHRDASFDSCPLCACHSNIRGLEVGVYVTPLPMLSNNPNLAPKGNCGNCTCGFSAVRHRYLSSGAGLFLEDELEATNEADFKQIQSVETSDMIQLIDLIRQQSLVRDLRYLVRGPWVLRGNITRMAGSSPPILTQDVVPRVEWRDLNQLCDSAMEGACMVVMDDCTKPSRSESDLDKQTAVHKWGYRTSDCWTETSDLECLGVTKNLTEILREALMEQLETGQIEGCLTWRSFERKCSRSGPEDACQPEPIPQLLLANEKDNLCVAPQSLRLWDRLLFEPYCQQKDVVYVVVVPDNPLITNCSKTFFRELSKTYENYRFGKHCPLTKTLSEGLLRVGSRTVQGEDSEADRFPSSDLERVLGQDNFARIKAYSKFCREYAYLLRDEAFDRHIFRDIGKENHVPASESMPPPPPPSGAAAEPPGDPTAAGDAGADSDSEAGMLPHVFVVYMLNPIVFGPENHKRDYS